MDHPSPILHQPGEDRALPVEALAAPHRQARRVGARGILHFSAAMDASPSLLGIISAKPLPTTSPFSSFVAYSSFPFAWATAAPSDRSPLRLDVRLALRALAPVVQIAIVAARRRYAAPLAARRAAVHPATPNAALPAPRAEDRTAARDAFLALCRRRPSGRRHSHNWGALLSLHHGVRPKKINPPVLRRRDLGRLPRRGEG